MKIQKFNVFCENQPITNATYVALRVVNPPPEPHTQSLNVAKIAINFEGTAAIYLYINTLIGKFIIPLEDTCLWLLFLRTRVHS